MTRRTARLGTIEVIAIALTILAAACGGDGEDAQGTTATEVTLLTHDSFAVPDEVWAAFTDETGITVTVIQGGDAGSVVNQAILTRDNPTADVLFGVDNTFLSRALDADLFLPYQPSLLDRVPDSLVLDPDGYVTPVDFGDVCLNYDVAAFAASSPPATLIELTEPAYRDALVVQNPATSSPGLAFLLSTIDAFPESSDYPWQAFWQDLAANGVLITDGWETAYYSEFSGSAGGGDRPVVVSYASSPPAEVIFSEPRPETAPTGVVTDGCFRQIEFAGILHGTERRGAAEQLVDFLLSRTFQDEIALNMFVFPANQDADVPQEFIEFTELPAAPATLDPATIEENRERWIAEWTELMR